MDPFSSFSVGLSGDTLIAAGTEAEACAYVYARGGTSWALQQRLAVGDATAGGYPAVAVGVSGDTAVLGAAFAHGQGAAHVFVRQGTAWTEQQALHAGPDVALDDAFGSAVSLSGDTLVVGAGAANAGVGRAYVFMRSGTIWSEPQALDGADPQDAFGRSVSVSADTIVVGGRAGVRAFARDDRTWALQQKLTDAEGAPGDFGAAVSVSGDTMAVGVTGAARADVFVRDGTTWTKQQELTVESGTSSSPFFGATVSVSGDTLAVGNPAGVFVRSGTTWTEEPFAPAPPSAYLGAAAFTDGDTVVVADGDASGRNTAFVFARTATSKPVISGGGCAIVGRDGESAGRSAWLAAALGLVLLALRRASRARSLGASR